MIKWVMYAIRNEDEDLWWNAELEGWVDEFEIEGDCLFPTASMAQNYIDDCVQEVAAKVYKVELLTGQTYEYEPIN